jgi:hypothetical protein
MIYVTNEARQELRNLLPADRGAPEAYLRIIDRGQGKLELDTGKKGPDDQVVEYDGTVILIAEPRFASDCDNVSLDVYDTSEGHRFVISEEIIGKSSRSVTVNWVNLPRIPCSA